MANYPPASQFLSQALFQNTLQPQQAVDPQSGQQVAADPSSPTFAPSFGQDDAAAIQRKRALAQALLNGTQTPTGTQVVSGHAIRNSPLEGLGNLAKAFAGTQLNNQANDQEAAYKDRTRQALAAALGGKSLDDVQAALSSTPALYDQVGPTLLQAKLSRLTTPQPRPATPAELKALNLPANASVIFGADGKPQVLDNGGLTPEQKNYQAAQAAGFKGSLVDFIQGTKEKTTRPVYLNDDGTINQTIYNAEKGLRTASTQLRIDNPKPGAAGVDPNDTEAVAQGIATGQLAPLSGVAARSPGAAHIMARVLQINPDYRATDYSTGSAGEKYFTTGKGGQTLKSLETAQSHLDTLGKLGDALQNNNLPLANKLSNAFGVQVGDTAPVAFNAAKKIVADEIVKAIVGSGGGVSDREEAAKTINDAQTPAQLKNAISTYKELMRGQVEGLSGQFESLPGKQAGDFAKRFPAFAHGVPDVGGSSPTPAAAPSAGGVPPDIAAILAKHGAK